MTIPNELPENVEEFQVSRNLTLVSCLGAGTQGSVFAFNSPSRSHPVAVKFHQRNHAYDRELAVYLRLRDLEITHVCGHRVPLLIDKDDAFLALGMTIVSPPFVLDFGGAYLDAPPDYSPEVWADWRRQKQEDFGDNWPAVEQILADFQEFGIYIADVNPGNIRFR